MERKVSRYINKLLIANRGEITARIASTAQEMGIHVVVLYTKDDVGHTYLKTANTSVLLEGKGLSETFLNKEKIVDIALLHEVDAIHPGYGFLSENAAFAKMVEEMGMLWVGPSPDVIELMGYKKSAREFAEKNDVPVLTANYGDAETLKGLENQLQFPVMIKAQAGGGGKGMRIVHNADQYAEALDITAREAMMLFGNDGLYVEHFIEKARHIEVQILGDNFGNIVCLGERECSVQRRHQKLIEEAPAYGISEELRKKLHNSAIKISKAANYKSAGTVEFIVDEKENFYFLEMNTRIQVEHPVTELVFNVNVVKEQLLVAAGSELSIRQEEVVRRGHALECRLYAEDPEQGFAPQNGKLTLNAAPVLNSVRVDGSLERTAHLSPAYDPLIAKVITVGKDRLEAMKNMTRALKDYKIQGVKTNKGFLTNLLNSPVLIQNKIYTQYCDLHAEKHFGVPAEPDCTHVIGWFLLNSMSDDKSTKVWQSLGMWRQMHSYRVVANDKIYKITAFKTHDKKWDITVNNQSFQCVLSQIRDYQMSFTVNSEPIKMLWSKKDDNSYFIGASDECSVLVQTEKLVKKKNAEQNKLSGNVLSPLPGRVMRIYVEPGEKVLKGKPLLVIESMKIENKVVAERDSVIKSVLVSEGQQLEGNDIMIELE